MQYYRITNRETGKITYTNYLPTATANKVEEISFNEFQTELERVCADEEI